MRPHDRAGHVDTKFLCVKLEQRFKLRLKRTAFFSQSIELLVQCLDVRLMKRAAFNRKQFFAAGQTRSIEKKFNRLAQGRVGVLALHYGLHKSVPACPSLSLIRIKLLAAISVSFRVSLVATTSALIAVELVGMMIVLLLGLVSV